MEIKVGDKVRFNYDTTPRIYLIYSKIGIAATCVVDDIQDGNSVVKYDDSEQIKTLIIPTKYLVKVDAEPKAPTAPAIKVGDNVRNIITGEVGRVFDIQRHVAKVGVVCDWKDCYWDLNNIEFFVPKAEECHYIPTEAEKKPNVGSIKIPVEVDLTDSYWDAYTADLAKEIAIVYAKQKRDVRMAVRAAKSVVEELKKK